MRIAYPLVLGILAAGCAEREPAAREPVALYSDAELAEISSREPDVGCTDTSAFRALELPSGPALACCERLGEASASGPVLRDERGCEAFDALLRAVVENDRACSPFAGGRSPPRVDWGPAPIGDCATVAVYQRAEQLWAIGRPGDAVDAILRALALDDRLAQGRPALSQSRAASMSQKYRARLFAHGLRRGPQPSEDDLRRAARELDSLISRHVHFVDFVEGERSLLRRTVRGYLDGSISDERLDELRAEAAQLGVAPRHWIALHLDAGERWLDENAEHCPRSRSLEECYRALARLGGRPKSKLVVLGTSPHARRSRLLTQLVERRSPMDRDVARYAEGLATLVALRAAVRARLAGRCTPELPREDATTPLLGSPISARTDASGNMLELLYPDWIPTRGDLVALRVRCDPARATEVVPSGT